MKVAFLGLGKMGAVMAGRLLDAGHPLAVWNRTPERARSLVAAGASLAVTAADAARDADAVLSMLFDDAAYEEVFLGAGGDWSRDALAAFKPGAVHIALSTISVALSERLTAEHAGRGQLYVAAPVFGRPDVAAQGRLWVVVAGSEEAVARTRTLLEPMSRGVSVLGTKPSQAHALKLGGNFLICAMIHSLGEAFVYAKGQGIDAQLFLETVNSALFQSPLYAAYGKVMLDPPSAPGATMNLGAKDLELLRVAARGRGTRLSLADALADVFVEAQEAGLDGEDWAVGQYRMAERRGMTTA